MNEIFSRQETLDHLLKVWNMTASGMPNMQSFLPPINADPWREPGEAELLVVDSTKVHNS